MAKRTGIPQPLLKALTIRNTKAMKIELDDLHKKYDSGELLISYGQYKKLRHGIMNNHSINKVIATAALIKKEVKQGKTTWKEQLKFFGVKGKAKSRKKSSSTK